MLSRVLLAFYRQATASKPRCIVFSILLLWALADAVLTAKEMPTMGVAVTGFSMSFGWSLLFIGLIILVWDRLAMWFRRPKNDRS